MIVRRSTRKMMRIRSMRRSMRRERMRKRGGGKRSMMRRMKGC